MPTDLLTATQDAVFAALSAPGALPVPVYQHVPEGTQPPMVIVGDIEAEPFGEKDGGIDGITFEIGFVHRGSGRRPLLSMMHAARTALEGRSIAADGALFGAPTWLSSAAVGADDGVTYAGLQRFQTIAQSDA